MPEANDSPVAGDAAGPEVHGEGVADSSLSSADLAPTRPAERKWRARDYAVLWISLSACVPTYMLASSLIASGMSWRQAVGTVFLGNVIVLVPMILNGHAGTRYGIPFPVYCRASFGVLGANVPALLRAVVACGWFGIQCWIGGEAIYTALTVWLPSWERSAPTAAGVNLVLAGCFLAFWGANVVVIWRGIESIRLLLTIKAPLLILLGLALLGWAYREAGGMGPILEQPSRFGPGGEKAGQFWSFFFPALTAMVGFWATLSLNIPDFTRYARSQRDQMLGQALGLPTTMGLYSFIGVAVTSATVVLYGEAIWNPAALLSRFRSPWVLATALFALCLATLATNLAANVVSPANDFANLWPSRISFRTGGLITAVAGILIQPWKLVAGPSGYIYTWLVGYSSLLGAVGGVLIADYFVIRGTRLDAAGLYRRRGPYWYRGGFNGRAFVALAAGIAPCVPGFLDAVGLVDAPEPWRQAYHHAWFLGFGTAFAVYVVLMGLAGRAEPRSART
jgi:NCS1 family nucleobase:cation symporter-1